MKKAAGHRAAFIVLLLIMITGMCRITASAQTEDTDTQVKVINVQKVKTISWRARLRCTVKKGKKVLAKEGSTVEVVSRDYNYGGKSLVKLGKYQVRLKNSCLRFLSDMASVSKTGDYTKETKEAFINGKNASSRTRYLIWVSLDKQRVNIFTGKKGNWRLIRVYPCSSGATPTPTRSGWRTVDYKRKVLKGLLWFTDLSGGGFHKWPGKVNMNVLGKHTASHGCVRLTESDAKALYDLIPVHTKILVY